MSHNIERICVFITQVTNIMMQLKTINITIPQECKVPEIITSFTPEENFLMLKIGSECLKEGRNAVAGLTQKEIYAKIKNESKEQLQKMEIDLLVEREMIKKTEDRMSNMYQIQLDKLKKEMDTIVNQLSKSNDLIKSYELNNKELLNSEIAKTKDKYDTILLEKDKQIQKINETHELILIQSQKNTSTSCKGKEGEKEFELYADETFQDFKGYELVDKHTQGGAGDFHMRFDDFDVLVDAKNYKKKVPIEQREKIKKDLMKNEHMTFAWLVSLNTSIDKFDKAPIMYEWVNTKQCIVYINNLSQNEDPRKILRIAWFTCKELYKLVENVSNDDVELTDLKEKQFKCMDKIKIIRKGMREINTTLNTTRSTLQLIDDQLKEILDTETSQIVESNYSLFDSWWDTNIELTNEPVNLLSTDLWIKFKQDNKSIVKDFSITTDKFKQFIKAKTQLSNIILKSKNANSAIEIKGIKLKELVNNIVLEIISVPEPNKPNILNDKAKILPLPFRTKNKN